MADQISTAGADVIIKLIKGFGDKDDVVTAGVAAVLKFIEGLGKNAIDLAKGAAQVLTDFLNGMATAIRDMMTSEKQV
jgi:hypothetical protein